MASTGQLAIGKAAALSGLSIKTIRYYEAAGVIASATRNGASYRTYTEADVRPECPIIDELGGRA